MASAPQVQSLAQIMADLAPASSQQTSLIQQQQAGLGAKYAGQQAALDATKAQGFDAISANQRGRGNAFSGIPADEQATYLSTSYLPEVAKLTEQQNTENMGLQSDLADIYSNDYNTAFGKQSTQESSLNSWNMQQMQNEYSAAEAERQRTFDAGQNAANRAVTQAQYDKDNEAMTPFEAGYSVIANAVAGGRAISPEVFITARDAYKVAGGDASQFTSDFWSYVPADQQTGEKWKTYYYGTTNPTSSTTADAGGGGLVGGW